MFLPTKFSHLIPETWKIALVFLEHNFDLDTCGGSSKSLDLNSLLFKSLHSYPQFCEKPDDPKVILWLADLRCSQCSLLW